jgi:hypothetical protein
VALARLTASLTQSLMGASLVWHMRQMSPVDTSWEKMVLPAWKTGEVQYRGSVADTTTHLRNEPSLNYTQKHSKGYRPDTLS